MERMLPLIGRDRELQRFAALLRRAAPGRATVLVVDGPPDSGRRRLLRALAAAGREAGAAVTADGDRIILVCGPPGPEAPVLVITTAEPAMPAEVYRMLLPPLARPDVRRLITVALGMPAGDRLVDLAGVAAGRPGAILDLVAGLREEGLLRVSDGAAVPTVTRLPERTGVRLAHRLATLSPSARHLVQAATALRSPFPPARLSALLGSNVVTLLPDIEEALASGFLVASGDALALSHDLVRPVVEASMPRAVVAALRLEQDRTTRRTPVARHRPPPAPSADWSLLSERELEIAELVGAALTNRQIAGRLGRSPHTVNYHLRQIFRKLGFASRVELVSQLRRREADQSAALAR